MQLYRKIIRNYWCGEKCHFHHACAPTPADAFRWGGYAVQKHGGLLFHACPGSAGSRAGAVAVPVLVEGLPCPCPATSLLCHSQCSCSVTGGALLSFHAWLDGIPSIVAV